MLILPIKKKWFDMILSGEKKEEYREIKKYYDTRFTNCGLFRVAKNTNENKEKPSENSTIVRFRNGYSNSSPYFDAKVHLTISEGNPNWGAEPGVEYYVLHIKEIISTYKCEAVQLYL